ncbi:hypothetical protein BD779DRAFT_1431724 [Infundibulicybe gibba]|nr:hypothetical protein BD779DRAFT_1431724 [Infundibulicybe gibba]
MHWPTTKLSLKHFILKQQVFDLYRYAIRASRVIPNPLARRETIAWIRGEIEINRHLTNVHIIEDKIKIIHREIRQILPSAPR